MLWFTFFDLRLDLILKKVLKVGKGTFVVNISFKNGGLMLLIVLNISVAT